MKITTELGENIVFFDAETEPFRIYGLLRDEGGFVRMSVSVAKTVNEGVGILCKNTAGGRVRFKTNSKAIAIKVVTDTYCTMSHMALTGSNGFDLYEKCGEKYFHKGTFVPPYKFTDTDRDNGYESIICFADKKDRDITINFPLYNNVRKLYIGLEKDAEVGVADSYRHTKPIVFYGSSITQGGCASRPGNAYTNIISRKYDVDIVNLGFSGSGKGERAIAEYIAGLDMGVFVYDYDHNAPSAEYLKKTHQPMFNIIREKHPDLPIILMTMPATPLTWGDQAERKQVVRETFEAAKNSGDQNVYFVSGDEIFKMFGEDDCTVDSVHPNDMGFMCMAKALEPILNSIFIA